jgi:hypothetical protein
VTTVRAVAFSSLCAAVLAGPFAGCRFRTNDSSTGAADAAPTTQVEMGALAVAQRRCGQCHQSPDPADGILSGQTTAVPGTQAYGSNLTPDPDTGMDAWDPGTVVAALTKGIDPSGNVLCPAMPIYCDMSLDEALAIAAYLRSLTPVWHPIPTSVCPPYEPIPDGGFPVLRDDCADAGDGGSEAQ